MYIKKYNESIFESNFKDNFQEVIDLSVGKVDVVSNPRESIITITDIEKISLSEMTELYTTLSFCSDRISNEFSCILHNSKDSVCLIFNPKVVDQSFIEINKKEFDDILLVRPSIRDYDKLKNLTDDNVSLRQSRIEEILITKYEDIISDYYIYTDNERIYYYIIRHDRTQIDKRFENKYFKCKDLSSIVKYIDEN